ncbi:ATP-grasp domain-containing protein [Catellatospora paridis]|uniref:ATP-grasp domain-containing protein n=1 Tax=Catellatospora paridis TaxID=1617086 RepID=UPI0012D3B272|nr:ATP-grasp domain-containing protein [Catellatospora paridis]
MKSVLILSWISIGNVAPAVKEVRARNLRPVLVSESPDDPNAALCDDHVLFDWDSDELSTLAGRLDERGIVPIAVVNMVEKLISWNIAIAAHYGLPGGDAGRTVLASKTSVRDHMRSLGLSGIKYCSDPAAVDFFPVIVKPARVSGASHLVSRADNPAELFAYQQYLIDRGSADIEMVIEEYLPGTEFSVDGPVVNGRFHPVLAVEKPDHDDVKHHDAGLEFHPPQQDHVREGVRELCETISTLCTDLRLDQLWLHFEGRSTEDGRTELIEINPRPGGGQIPKAVQVITGMDPFAAVISMALGEFTVERPEPLRLEPMIGWMDVEADEYGTVEVRTTEDELLALPGVIGIKLLNGLQATSDKENFFLSFSVTADSVSELRAHAANVLQTLDYRVTP